MHNRFQFITLNTGILTVFTVTDDEQMSFGCIEWEKSDSAIWSPENTYFSLTLFLVGWSCLKFRNSTSNDFSHGIAKRSGDYFFYALDFPYIKQFVALCHALVTEYFTVIKEATSVSHKSLSCTDR